MLARRQQPAQPADAPLDEQLEVNGAVFVLAETVVEGVGDAVEAQLVGTAPVGTVQERTVLSTPMLDHVTLPFSPSAWSVIGNGVSKA
jgi:hypothetical protein